MDAIILFLVSIGFCSTSNVLCSSEISHSSSQNVAEAAEDIFEDFFNWRMERSPEFATFIGLKQYNDFLETFTEERFADDLAWCKECLLRSAELRNQTSDESLLMNLEFLDAELNTFIDGYRFKGFYFPINYLEGVQVDFQRLAEWTTFENVSDYEDLIARYNLFDQYVQQIIKMLQTAVEQKMTYNNVSMNSVSDQLEGHINSPLVDSIFYEPFKNMSAGTDFEQEILQSEALMAIEFSIYPALSSLKTFLEEEYLPFTRPEIALSSLPELGVEFYDQMLKFHTSTNMTATEIHNLGLAEVDRIEVEMKMIIEELGFGDMTLQEFSDYIRNDPNNYYDNPEALLEGFTDILENRVNPHLLEIFSSIPEAKLLIKSVSESAKDGPAAFYSAGSLDGKRPGVFYVNTYKYASQPKYEMVTLAMHEANPGHHLQSSFQLEAESFPTFRKVMEDRIYSQAPSRFPINTAYVEGWALYSEKLGFDLNLYDDPMDRFGHLSEEIFRACRLVVDTGMHALGWEQEQAVQFMLAHTAASEDGIRSEISRYITWPGQATAYKVGQLTILDLRKMAEDSLGEKFDIRDFHQIVLESVGPLEILKKNIDKYINSKS